MKSGLATYMAVLVSYVSIDLIWLTLIAQQSYQNAIGHLMRDQFPIWSWVCFYLLYSLAITKLVVLNNNDGGSGDKSTIVNAGLFGAAAYGAYNFTNYTVLASWPLGISVKDWIWGITISIIISCIGVRVKRRFA